MFDGADSDDSQEEDDDFAKSLASSAPPDDPRVVAAPKGYCKSVTALQVDSVEVRLLRSLTSVEIAEQAFGGGEHGVVPGGGPAAKGLELMR